MKNYTTLIALLLISFLATAQDTTIETKSVSIENLISFVVDTIEIKTENSNTNPQHLVFLIQTPISDLNVEDKVILKQAFKLISNRLSGEDTVSIVAYSGLNGIVLRKTSANNLKEMMYALENLKSSIAELHKDGIELAYTYANENLEEDTKSTIVMIRNPKSMIARSSVNSAIETPNVTETSKKSNAVWLAAITLLPQIISVIKD